MEYQAERKVGEFFKVVSLLATRALFIVFPYVGVYGKSLGSARHRYFNIAYLAYFSCSFAFLLVLRDPQAGVEAGYGADAQYYMDAFDALKELEGFYFNEILEVGLMYTGSAEPIFWLVSYFFSNIVDAPIVVWWLIGTLTIFLMAFSALKIDTNIGFYVVTLFVSTITYYVFPGSGLRQGLAFAVLFSAVVALFIEKKALSTLFSVLAVLIHSSSLPVAVILMVTVWDSKKWSARLLKVVLVFLAALGFYFVQAAQLESKFAAYEDVARQDLAYVQAAVESIFFLGLVLFFRRLFSRQFKLSFYYFLASLVVVALFFQGGGFERYYRYLYVFGIYMLATISVSNKWFLRASLSIAACWLVFIVSTRYAGLFSGEGVIEHLLYSPFYAFFKEEFNAVLF